MNRRDVRTSAIHAGQLQMDALTDATLQALHRAGLADTAGELQRRVLDRGLSETCELTEEEGETPRIAYKPMIELLLHEVRHVARMPHVTASDRRARIDWAMTLAGV
jgi:hypothetical protein